MPTGAGQAGGSADVHAAAAEAFVDRVRSQYRQPVARLYVFGSTVRSQAQGLDSDVDILLVIKDDADRAAVTDEIRDIAYDVMLEYGPVVELHVLTESTFEQHQHEGNPFVRRVTSKGRRYV